jgi:IS30 family transposase
MERDMESTPPKPRPWHRRKGETAQQFKAFEIYLQGGGSRLDVANGLYERSEKPQNLYTKVPGNIVKWSAKHQWVQRRLSYADHLTQVRQNAVEDEVKKDGVDWAKRRGELDEKIMRASEAILERINAMLSFPLVRKKTETVVSALIEQAKKIPTELYQSLTWDREREMADHKRFTQATNIAVYFCDPQSPWQRGSNENTNGLLRRYFPKGTDLSVHSQEHLDKIARKLNERPRKTLEFETPAELFDASVALTG